MSSTLWQQKWQSIQTLAHTHTSHVCKRSVRMCVKTAKKPHSSISHFAVINMARKTGGNYENCEFFPHIYSYFFYPCSCMISTLPGKENGEKLFFFGFRPLDQKSFHVTISSGFLMGNISNNNKSRRSKPTTSWVHTLAPMGANAE